MTISHGVATITDRGVTADQLEDAGVNVDDQPRAARSFAAVRDSIGLPFAIGAGPWEIASSVDVGDIAIAVQVLADAAIRADGLRVLGSGNRATSFADKSVSRLSARTAVVPKAKMPGRHGGDRQVTLAYKGNDDARFYVQALSGSDKDSRTRSYDHASGLFLGAPPDQKHRVALRQNASWELSLINNLREVCQVVDEDEIDDFVSSTAAA